MVDRMAVYADTIEDAGADTTLIRAIQRYVTSAMFTIDRLDDGDRRVHKESYAIESTTHIMGKPDGFGHGGRSLSLGYWSNSDGDGGVDYGPVFGRNSWRYAAAEDQAAFYDGNGHHCTDNTFV